MRISGPYADNWDNYTALGQFATNITQNLLNNLTYLDPADGSTIRPDLAQTWTVSPDGKTVTYSLRKDATWHDGTPFTSKDALYSLNRAKSDPKAPINSARLRIVDQFTAPDDSTIRVTLSAPSVSFLIAMSVPQLQVYPAHVPDASGEWVKTRIGTGPFKFKEHRIGVVAELTRSDRYFKKGNAGRSLPYLDGIRYIWIVDRALTLSAFRTGELDCLCSYSSDVEVGEKDAVLKAVPNAKFGNTPSTLAYFVFNSRPPFNNQKVRQAISIGFDRKAVQETYRQGQGLYPPTYFVSTDFGGKLSLPSSEFLTIPGFRLKNGKKDQADLDMARRLWQEAGLDPKNVKIDFSYSTGAYSALGELLTQLLADLGMRVNALPLPSAQETAGRLQGSFDIGLDPANNAFDDPADLMIPVTTTGGPRNWGKYSNPKVDQLAADQEREFDPVKRQQLIYALQREELDWSMYVPLVHLASVYGYAPYVEGFVLDRAFNLGSVHKMDAVWLNK